MANKYKKVSFVLRKELLIIVGVIAALILATILLTLPTKSEKLLAKWSAASSNIQSVEMFEELSESDLEKLLKKENKVFVLFVSDQDANSISLVETVYNSLSTYDVKKVYILDATDYLGDRKLDAELDTKLKSLEAKFVGLNISEAPTFWFFYDGKIDQQMNIDLVKEQSYSYTEAVKDILVYSAK